MMRGVQDLVNASKLLSLARLAESSCPDLLNQAWRNSSLPHSEGRGPKMFLQWRTATSGGIKNARELAAQKSTHRSAMADLRRQWTEQRQKEEMAFEKARAGKLASWQSKVAAGRKLRRREKRLEAAKRQKEQQLDAKIKDIKAQKSARWRQALSICYGRLNEKRRESLLELSKDWITPETLEDRINFALNNPSKLHKDPTAAAP